MSAMHHDTSPDLRVVGSKLKDILEVHKSAVAIRLNSIIFRIVFLELFIVIFLSSSFSLSLFYSNIHVSY